MSLPLALLVPSLACWCLCSRRFVVDEFASSLFAGEGGVDELGRIRQALPSRLASGLESFLKTVKFRLRFSMSRKTIVVWR